MGKDSKISWTTHTWNPWRGCRKVSVGCRNCYAEKISERMGEEFRIVRRSKTTFNDPLKWRDSAYVFTCSLSDFFIEEADPWRDEAWEIIRRTPHLTYQILTKRPENIPSRLPKTCFECGIYKADIIGGYIGDGDYDPPVPKCMSSERDHILWPWPNVWLGTSVENQQFAEKRIPLLTAIPAKVHFLSCEPLLGPIDFGVFGVWTPGAGPPPILIWEKEKTMLYDIEWVIVGGESGPNHRPMNLDWARSIRDQCKAANVHFFFKQANGSKSETPSGEPDLDRWKEMPDV